MRMNMTAEIVSKQFPDPDVNVNYPQVAGLRNEDVESSINKRIRCLVLEMMKEQGYGEEDIIDITGVYEIHLNQKCILSLTLEIYSYREHAAHGMTIRKSMTFNLVSGKLYRLGDLFTPGSHYVKILNARIKKIIIEDQVPIINEFTTIKPNQDFYMTEDSLVIYFQLYELTPYVYGFPQFSITYDSLRLILSPKGPAYRFL